MKRKKRGSSRFYLLYIFIVFLLAIGFLGVRALFQKLSYFDIRSISVSGNINLEKDFLVSFVKEYLGSNLYRVSKMEIEKKYENIIRIKSLKVKKIFPNKLKIVIRERVGEFFLKTVEGELFPVDSEKTVLDNENFYEKENLPLIDTNIKRDSLWFGEIVGNEFVDSVYSLCHRIKAVNSDFLDDISEIYQEDGDIYFIEMERGYKIVFGEDNLEDKLNQFTLLEENRTFEKGTIVDLRFKNILIVRAEDK